MISHALLSLALAASPADRLVGRWVTGEGRNPENRRPDNSLVLEPNGLARLLLNAGTWTADEKVIHLGLVGPDGELKTSRVPYRLDGDQLAIEISEDSWVRPSVLVMRRQRGPPTGPGPTKAPQPLGKGFARVGDTIFRAARTIQGGFITITLTEWVELPRADAATFRPVALDVGVDKSSVFCPERLEGYETQSLRPLGGLLYADSRGGVVHATTGSIPCRPVFRTQSPGSAREKFDGTVKSLGCNVLQDATGHYILVPDPSPFPPTKKQFTSEDLERIEKARLPWVAFQKTSVDPAKLKPGAPYCNELERPQAVLAGGKVEDPGDLGCGYRKEGAAYFWSDRRIAQADPGTFQVLVRKSAAACLKGWWAKDARAVFFKGEILSGADPATFQVLETAPFNYAFDKNNHYDQGVNIATLNRAAEEEAAFQKVLSGWRKR